MSDAARESTESKESEQSALFLRRLHQRDAQAAEEVFARYAQRLAHIAEAHLSRKLAGRLDAEDVVQSVFRTFFRRAAVGEFRIDHTNQLWRLLLKITVLKSRAKARHHTSQGRDVNAEIRDVDEVWLAEVSDREPGPQEAATLIDQIEILLRGLPEMYRDVMQLRLAGHTVAEVAEHLGVSRQTVYRTLGLLRSRLEESCSSKFCDV